MEVRVSIPLRDFYTGHEHEIEIDTQHICEACEGSGSADGAVDTCSQCGGRGFVVQKHMLAPGIFQQMQAPCDRCGGKGQTIKRPCKVCGGSRVVRKPDTHTLSVERGMPRGARIVFENEADESPDWEAGHLVVILAEKEPELAPETDDALADHHRTDGTFFRRKGDDLFWKEVLSLREAWLGDWTRNLTHLDGHAVRLHRPRGRVVQPGHVDVLRGEGMPVWSPHGEGDEPRFGNLVVEYAVVLPDRMDPAMEKDFWALWDKWRRKVGVDLGKVEGRRVGKVKDEL